MYFGDIIKTHFPKYLAGYIKGEIQLMHMGSGREPSEDDMTEWIKESIEIYSSIHNMCITGIPKLGE